MNRTELVKQASPRRPRRRPRATGAWLFGALIPLAACGDNGETAPNPAQVTDSAGITIVTSPPNSAVYATTSPEPVLSVGVLEGPDALMFGRVASARLDGAGNVVVADGQSSEIRVFDAGGNHLRTLGGAGEGPGEFQRLAGAWLGAAGEIVAVDSRASRITRFGAEGELLGAAPFAGSGLIGPLGLAGTDAVLTRVRNLPNPRAMVGGALNLEALTATMEEGTQHLLRHGLDGALIDTVSALPAAATRMTAAGSGETLTLQLMQVPFSPNPIAAGSRAGRIAVSGGGAYEILLHGLDGALERIVRLAEEPPLRTEAHLEAWVRGSIPSRIEPWNEADLRASMRAYEELPMPERLPAWDALLFADNGQIWARRYSIRGAETIVRDVFDAEGGHLGTVTTPANYGTYVEQVVDGRLVVIATDDFGVERVEVRELTLSGR